MTGSGLCGYDIINEGSMEGGDKSQGCMRDLTVCLWRTVSRKQRCSYVTLTSCGAR